MSLNTDMREKALTYALDAHRIYAPHIANTASNSKQIVETAEKFLEFLKAGNGHG